MQILSDPERRAQYDSYLQACSSPKATRHGDNFEMNKDISCAEDAEVVEWLRWYRNKAMSIVYQQEIGTGTQFCDGAISVHEALKRAYFGPCIEDDTLPDCFEAEERADATESEVLHLVSGRNFLGAVIQANQTGILKDGTERRISLSGLQTNLCKVGILHGHKETDLVKLKESQSEVSGNYEESAFVDLELYLHGNLVARATRSQYKSNEASDSGADGTDEINIYLCNNANQESGSHGYESKRKIEDILAGRILGLSATELGEKGRVYSPNGEHTHIIWQFRTPWVKHVHWFKIDGKQMLCECRSSRARLPSSKYWIFQPRSCKHNIGGWYIEMLWRNKERQTYWEKQLGLLHPAVYILGTAYKTLDTEVIKHRKRSLWSALFKQSLFVAAATRALGWCIRSLASN